jgi:hypothetical protein
MIIMPSEIRYTNPKTGLTYAYRSEARWDPEKGYSVPKRTYLGRVDPNTNEVIPSSGVRGRKKKEESVDAPSYLPQYEAALTENRALKKELAQLRDEVRELRNQKTRTDKALVQASRLIGSVLDDSQTV